MPKVVPSQIPPLIDRCFGWASQAYKSQKPQTLQGHVSMQVSAILAAVEAVPDHLIVLAADDFAEFVTAKAMLTQALRAWTQGTASGFHGPNVSEDRAMLPQYGHPIVALRSTMAKCPDEAPGATEGLPFIPDLALQLELRTDITRAESALANSGYKAATVMAGSVVEALLWWGLTARYTAAGRDAEATALMRNALGELITKSETESMIQPTPRSWPA